MIYTQIPLKCRFIPINGDDEVFQIIFMLYFRSFLKQAATVYMDIVNNPEEQNLNEGEIVYAAKWAKDIYNNYENIKENMDDFKVWCHQCKKKRHIAYNVLPKQIGFNFWEISFANVDKGILLYNEILEKYRGEIYE